MKRTRQLPTHRNILEWLNHPWPFTWFVIFFSLFGLLFIFDASVPDSLRTYGNSWHFAARHSVWLAIGLTVYLFLGTIPSQIWQKAAPWLFGLAVLLLFIVLIPGVGVRLQGAQRWIMLGDIPIQPAEITKLALIVFFASWLSRHQRFAPFLFFSALISTLILAQPNMSTAVILFSIGAVMYFLAGGNLKPLFVFLAISLVAGIALIFGAEYRRERLMTFINPASDPLVKSYHIRQITIALGRGGWLGQGIGLSKQKQHYIPEAANDSIFAVYAEETGFIGSLFLIGLYVLLLGTGVEVAKSQKEPFQFLVAAGITTWFAMQILINLAAMVALLPLTGIPLPLVSYGGSAYVSSLAGLGILFRLIREQTMPKRKSALKTRSTQSSSSKKLVRRL